MKQQVIHIVPQLPPQNSGVGDYATLVGRRMEEVGAGVVCGYVAAGQSSSELPADGPRIRNITGRCDPRALWRAVEELAAEGGTGRGGAGERKNVGVVLHYSGYGYDRNGCPAWLVAALRERPQWVGRVVTFFHELYATGRPWQRAFWYSNRQRRIAIEVARLSDEVLTNVAQSARWVEEQTGRAHGSVTSRPVPSNVGEPAEVPDYDSRPPRAVAFGGARSKRFALYTDARRVAQVLRQLDINELIDIGRICPVHRRPFERAGIAIRQLGCLDAADVSRELSECRVGFLDYPLSVVAKSGVFAAYAAHGVVPVLRDDFAGPADGIAIHKQALAFEAALRLRPSSGQLQHISDAARTWYGNSSMRHADAILRTILPMGGLISEAKPRRATSAVD